MLKVLGNKRVTFIFVMLVLIGGLSYLYYYWLLPMHAKTSQELQTSKSAVDQKYAEVARMKEEYVLLQSQLRVFKELEAEGFFNDQDRSAAVDRLSKLSNISGLLKANLKFGSGQLITDPLADQAGQVILKSPVTVTSSSIDDVDVYSFIKFIEEKFPGHVDLTSFTLERIEIFDTAVLRKIGSGEAMPLVNSSITYDWLTMAPKDIVVPKEENTEGGAQ
jgi:hypothetical protein